MSERKPLLPQHRFSQQPISFPSAGADEAQAAGGGESAGQPTTASLQHRIRTMSKPPERKPGTPKVTRECLWSEFKCYGKHIAPVIIVNAILLAIGLTIYFTRR